MSTTPIPQHIDVLSREKGIDPQVIISAMEDAVEAAARKQFKTGEDFHARYNPETGEVELFALMTVVEEIQDPATEITLADERLADVEGAEIGDQLEFPRRTDELGRIAAQTAKQIIFQKVREAERNNVYDEYIDRVGELVHGFVKRFEGGRIIVDLGKIEAVLPKTQQSRAEAFSQGERIRVVINTVSKDTKGPQVEVSRTSPELLKRLFEMEVPEIYDGTVQIKAAVREPGDRAKIAVISTERDVDPVGACVGMKGSRVQAIIRELRGERIDIIEWSEDPAVFAANALSPAKVSKVEINSFEEKNLTVTVPEDQLSLAIGKKGQNVRLAAKLVGWHIDIRSAEEAARVAAAQLEAVMAGGEATLTDIRDSLALDQITAERLKERGIENIDQLVGITVDELVDAIDVSFDQANEILERAHRLLAQKHAREAREAREAEEAAARVATEGEVDAGEAAAIETTAEESATHETAEESATHETAEESATHETAEESATPETAEESATPETGEELPRPESFEAAEIGIEEPAPTGAPADEISGEPEAAETAEAASDAEPEVAEDEQTSDHVSATSPDSDSAALISAEGTASAEEEIPADEASVSTTETEHVEAAPAAVDDAQPLAQTSTDASLEAGEAGDAKPEQADDDEETREKN